MNENKNRSTGAGLALILTSILVFVAWIYGMSLVVAVPLALVFSIGIGALVESLDE